MNWNNAMGFIRFIILPDNNDWQKVVTNSYTNENFTLKFKKSKKTFDGFDDCVLKLILSRSHHIFYKSEAVGTILMDSSVIGLEKFCINYSLESEKPVIILQGHPQCFDLYDIDIYKNGSLIRKSNYVREKLFNDASETVKPLYATFLNREIGEITVFEKLPHLLPLLYNFGWTEEMLDQNNWQMVTTNLD